MKQLIRLFALALVIILLGSCEKYEIIIGSDFNADIQPIFVEKCSGCHPSLLPPDFTEGNVYISLTQYSGGSLLDLDNPEESYILEKATDGHSSNDISANQEKAIIKWIENGANETDQ